MKKINAGDIMDPDKRRVLDAVITKDFLAKNQLIVRMIVNEFAVQMNAAGLTGPGYRFYLKGGNALSILSGRPIDGDYDFQLMPSDAAYADWGNSFPMLDTAIMNVLTGTIINVADQIAGMPAPQPGFNVSSFTAAALRGWAGTAGNPINKAGIDLSNLVQGDRQNNIRRIGINYRMHTFHQIVTDPNFVQNRIEGDVQIDIQNFNNPRARNLGPMIYVNYTIPGFILYRVVYSYIYNIGGDTFNLKSEIIDVSVPRPGSAERHMSQEGVVTHFRPAVVYPFDIPGWGYHFYENINLLQEIELGISGSPQKGDKRISRLGDSMRALITANDPNRQRLSSILKMTMNEPGNNGTVTSIRGYFGALAYNINDYNAYNQDAIVYLQNKIMDKISSHYKISESLWGQSKFTDCQKLVYYKLSSKFDKAVNTISAAIDLINIFLQPYQNQCEKRLRMTAGETFQYISPLTELLTDGLLPCDYIVAEVKTVVFNKLKGFCSNRAGEVRYNGFGTPVAAFSCVLNSPANKPRMFKGTLFVIFQDCGNRLSQPCNTHITEILQRSILESQRYSLTKSLEQH